MRTTQAGPDPAGDGSGNDRLATRECDRAATFVIAFHVVIRDGRVGRDPAMVGEFGGEILWEYDAEICPTMHWGEHLTLPSGETVTVVETRDVFSPSTGLQFTAVVSDSFLIDPN